MRPYFTTIKVMPLYFFTAKVMRHVNLKRLPTPGSTDLLNLLGGVSVVSLTIFTFTYWWETA